MIDAENHWFLYSSDIYFSSAQQRRVWYFLMHISPYLVSILFSLVSFFLCQKEYSWFYLPQNVCLHCYPVTDIWKNFLTVCYFSLISLASALSLLNFSSSRLRALRAFTIINKRLTRPCFVLLQIPLFLPTPIQIEIVSLSWNLVARTIRIWRIQWWCSLFLFSTRNTLFR